MENLHRDDSGGGSSLGHVPSGRWAFDQPIVALKSE
jgi:hypothetical protein